jgi:hypothetical protein
VPPGKNLALIDSITRKEMLPWGPMERHLSSGNDKWIASVDAFPQKGLGTKYATIKLA